MSNDDNSQTGLNYELLVEDALRSVVRSSLRIVENIGLPGETHFYISFITGYEGVEIDEGLRAKHPDQMTIVIQHQYADLRVSEDHFCITLFFGGKPSPMIIPFQAVTSMNDPSVGFGLQFGMLDENDDEDDGTHPVHQLAQRVQKETPAMTRLMMLAATIKAQKMIKLPRLYHLTHSAKDQHSKPPKYHSGRHLCTPLFLL